MDKQLADDVALFLINDYGFYKRCEMLRNNYAKKMKRGVYVPELAIKGMDCHIKAAIKSHEFKQCYCDLRPLPDPATRKLIAANVLEHWEEEIEELAEL